MKSRLLNTALSSISRISIFLLCSYGCNPASKEVPKKNEPVPETTANTSSTDKLSTGGDDDDNDQEDSGEASLVGGTLSVSVVSAGSLALNSVQLALAEIGQASPVALESLEYRISSIEICRDMQTNGTGFSQTVDCLEIYQGNNSDDYATYGYEQAKLDTENYVNLMDPDSLAKLSNKLIIKEHDAHDYNYGLVNWYQPIRVKASIPIAAAGQTSTTTVYTKDGPMVTESIGNDNYQKFTTRVANMTTAPAETSVIRHNNGGSWFKFAKPFVISKQDVIDKVSYKLDLTFNPDGVVKATTGSGSQISGVPEATFPDIGLDHPTYPAISYQIKVPMLGLIPIAHSVAKRVRKDSYLVHFDEVSDKFDIRVELYTLDGEADGAIYGIDIETLQTSASTDSVPDFYDPFFVEVGDDGEILMQTYEKKSIFKDFKRLAAPGDIATVIFNTGAGQACIKTDGDACFSDPTYSHQYSVSYEYKTSELLP